SKNLTPDRDTGIASWSDEQVIRAIREGVTKEGNLIGPPMPIALYNKIADDDVKAMVAYLRSVPPVRNEIPESKYKIKLHAEPTAKDVKAPPKTDKIAYGEYLVNVAHCLESHTPFAANGETDYAKRAGAGGREFFPIERRPVRARNISSDPETGIGSWTDAQIKKAITEGINKDGKKLIPPMPYGYFKNLAGEAEPMLTRRQFVTAVAGTAAPAALAADASERSPVYRRLPGAPAQARAGKTVTARFLAAERPTSLPCFAGRSLPMWTFTTGDWPPVIRLDLGDQLKAKLENRLPRAGELTSIHW